MYKRKMSILILRPLNRMVPRTTAVFLLTVCIVGTLKHLHRISMVSYENTKVHFYNKRRILSGGIHSEEVRITNVGHPSVMPTKAANQSSFYSLIPSQDFLTISPEQQAWVEIKTPQQSERLKQSKRIATAHSRRKSELRAACRRVGKPSNKWMDNIQLIAAPQRRLVVCHVQKAGSTSWHKLIYNLRHDHDQSKLWTNEGHIENRESTRNLTDVTKRLLTRSRNATRVLCVRHPFARLISGWNNKFHKNFVASVGNVMFKSMPGLADYVNETSPPDKDHVISFEDFVRYIADHGLDRVDAHFKTIDQLCKPCSYPYDFIVKAETAPNDLWWLLNRINATMERFLVHNAIAMTGNKVMTVESHSESRDKSTENIFSAIVRHFFSRVPRETIRSLMSLYYDDFAHFGYTFDIETLSSGGFR